VLHRAVWHCGQRYASCGWPLSVGRRTGVGSPAAAVALFEAIQAELALNYVGVQFYCGAQQHIESYEARRQAIAERAALLRAVIDALGAVGGRPRIVTGGGTGSHVIDAEIGVFNELQVGSYIFMDRQYSDCDLTGSAGTTFETSLAIDARVISANHTSLVTVDAGFKAFATEAGAPPILSGAVQGATFRFMGDEQGCVIPPRGEAPPRLGEVVTFATPHCDPTVNLYEAYHVVKGDTLVGIWPIEARGRSA